MYSDYTSSDNDYNINNEDSYNDNNNEQNNKYKKWIFIGLIIVCIILLILVILKFKNQNNDKTKLYFTDTNLYLKQGESQKIDLNLSSSDKNYTVKWSTSNDNIMVTDDGVVKALEPGDAIITVIGKDGTSATCQVTVVDENSEIEIKSISLDIEELELEVGEKYQFTLNVNPTNADILEITWESSNLDILNIENDTVEALSVGSSVVTVRTKNGLVATCNVKVKENNDTKENEETEVLPSKIKLNINSRILNIGDTLDLSVTFEPENVTNKDIIWKSSDSEIVSIENGKLHALKGGIAIITAKTVNDKTSSCTIVVNNTSNNNSKTNTDTKTDTKTETKTETKIEKELKTIKLNKNSLTLKVGEKTKLSVSISPINVESKYLKFTWTSSNSNVVSVDANGNIVAKNAGNAVISVKSINGITATCNITVIQLNIKTFDQRNDAVVYYYSLKTKDIKAVDKKYKCKKDIKKGNNNCDMPKVYSTSLTGNIKIYKYNESSNNNTYIKTVTKDLLPYNLIPNVIYYLESENNANNNEYVKITGDLRMIKVNGIRNIRDLGGYKADGGVVKYGKLYRGANPNYVENQTLTTNILRDLGISVIFDLRESSEFKRESKKLSSFEKINNDTGYYLTASKYSNTRTSVEKIMQEIVKNKGVYFHCAAGTDRTGTVGYLLEGILGISKEERLNDFELSYFYEHYNRTNRNGKEIKVLSNKVDSFGGNKDQEKFINWFLSDSKNLESDIKLINDFRKSMINGNPTMYKVQNKKCVAI